MAHANNTITAPGQYLPWIHGFYYLLSGVWPILDSTSFQVVTGPKTDIWLVKTVGLLLMVTGLVLLAAAHRRRIHPELLILAIGDAMALIVIEVFYWADGTLSAIYLLDAVVEVFLIVCWLLVWKTMRQHQH